MVNVTGCYKDTECDNITAHPAVHYTLLSLQASFIPVIIFASIFVIVAVRLVRKLNTPHNKLLQLISWMDLLIGIIVIPANLLRNIPGTRHHFHCNNEIAYQNTLLLLLKLTIMVIQIMSLTFLTMLTLDSFIQLNFPIAYIRHVTVKRIQVCSGVIAFIYVVFEGVIYFTGSDEITVSDFTNFDGFLRYYNKFYIIFCIIVCFFCAVEVRIMRWKYSTHEQKREVTNWLLVVFIILYLPTIIYRMVHEHEHDDHDHEDHYHEHTNNSIDEHNLINLIRYAVSATNGILIYRSRHIYKTTFHFFLTTNPLHWHDIEGYINSRKSTWARSYQATRAASRAGNMGTSMGGSRHTQAYIYDDDDSTSIQSVHSVPSANAANSTSMRSFFASFLSNKKSSEEDSMSVGTSVDYYTADLVNVNSRQIVSESGSISTMPKAPRNEIERDEESLSNSSERESSVDPDTSLSIILHSQTSLRN